MATESKTNITTPLGRWVDELLYNIWFQPDDELAMKSFEEGIDPKASVKVNQTLLKGSQYLEIVKAARSMESMETQSNDEIQVWHAPDGDGGGCVGHLGYFTRTNKVTGKVVKGSSLTLANVKIRDEKKVLVELTEIIN